MAIKKCARVGTTRAPRTQRTPTLSGGRPGRRRGAQATGSLTYISSRGRKVSPGTRGRGWVAARGLPLGGVAWCSFVEGGSRRSSEPPKEELGPLAFPGHPGAGRRIGSLLSEAEGASPGAGASCGWGHNSGCVLVGEGGGGERRGLRHSRCCEQPTHSAGPGPGS